MILHEGRIISHANKASSKRRLPLVVRLVEWERYNPDDPFPLVTEPRSSSDNVKPKVAVFSIRRASFLLTFLIWLLPFAQVDDFNILPSAIIIYSLGVCYLHELLLDTTLEESFERKQKQLQEEYLQQQYDRALFELRVLQKRPNVRLVRRVENGVTSLYAID